MEQAQIVAVAFDGQVDSQRRLHTTSGQAFGQQVGQRHAATPDADEDDVVVVGQQAGEAGRHAVEYRFELPFVVDAGAGILVHRRAFRGVEGVCCSGCRPPSFRRHGSCGRSACGRARSASRSVACETTSTAGGSQRSRANPASAVPATQCGGHGLPGARNEQ
ncbi:MAG: hypothetical protein AW07_01410 [Candidatus Accumulibacter sp. SK-11]|nr:MAG: hypothetical protein AW07_01410 [Candidatus Accumulibacter sp. SK-11]